MLKRFRLCIMDIDKIITDTNYFSGKFTKEEHFEKILKLVQIEYWILKYRYDEFEFSTIQLTNMMFDILDIKNPIIRFRFRMGLSDYILKRKLKGIIDHILSRYEGYIVAVFNMLLVDYLDIIDYANSKNPFSKELSIDDLEKLLILIDNTTVPFIFNTPLFNNLVKIPFDVIKNETDAKEFIVLVKMRTLKEYKKFKYL